MTCKKHCIPPKKVKKVKKATESKMGVPMYAYDCPHCGKIHLTTTEPGSEAFKKIGASR